MGKITVETCGIDGLKIITPTVFNDARGYFVETYNYNDYKEAGIDQVFVQDNQSASTKGVLRGLHFQINYPQYCSRQRMQNSFLSLKILPTVSM